MQLNQDIFSGSAVGSSLVVVPAQILHFWPCVVKVREPARVQAFAAELAVERFDEGIVCQLSKSREVEGEAVGIGPEIEVAGGELAALIDTNRLWMANLSTDAFKRPVNVFRSVAEPWTDDG